MESEIKNGFGNKNLLSMDVVMNGRLAGKTKDYLNISINSETEVPVKNCGQFVLDTLSACKFGGIWPDSMIGVFGRMW